MYRGCAFDITIEISLFISGVILSGKKMAFFYTISEMQAVHVYTCTGLTVHEAVNTELEIVTQNNMFSKFVSA